VEKQTEELRQHVLAKYREDVSRADPQGRKRLKKQTDLTEGQDEGDAMIEKMVKTNPGELLS
jgi:hypothetical protein